MNKKTQTIVTICVDISMLAIIVIASYLLLTQHLSGILLYATQLAVIVAIPTLFLATFLTFGMQKYETLRPEDEEEETAESGELTGEVEQKESDELAREVERKESDELAREVERKESDELAREVERKESDELAKEVEQKAIDELTENFEPEKYGK